MRHVLYVHRRHTLNDRVGLGLKGEMQPLKRLHDSNLIDTNVNWFTLVTLGSVILYVYGLYAFDNTSVLVLINVFVE